MENKFMSIKVGAVRCLFKHVKFLFVCFVKFGYVEFAVRSIQFSNSFFEFNFESLQMLPIFSIIIFLYVISELFSF